MNANLLCKTSIRPSTPSPLCISYDALNPSFIPACTVKEMSQVKLDSNLNPIDVELAKRCIHSCIGRSCRKPSNSRYFYRILATLLRLRRHQKRDQYELIVGQNNQTQSSSNLTTDEEVEEFWSLIKYCLTITVILLFYAYIMVIAIKVLPAKLADQVYDKSEQIYWATFGGNFLFWIFWLYPGKLLLNYLNSNQSKVNSEVCRFLASLVGPRWHFCHQRPLLTCYNSHLLVLTVSLWAALIVMKYSSHFCRCRLHLFVWLHARRATLFILNYIPT